MARHDSMIPSAKSGAYAVGEYIYTHGMADVADMRVILKKTRDESIYSMVETWIARGWFFAEPYGRIVLTRRAKQYFDGINPVKPEPGQVATGPQINMLARPAYKPPKPVRRQDIPAWSGRPEGFGFVTISGVQP
jgi:hypothetical protein